uniref:Transport and golgi organization 2-like protein n=1 Tax=Rhipicephalus appendiculatus TaxID=34631 RepID=A0A131YMH6_RHIAP
MCLLFVYTNPDPDDDEFSMVLVNVRDEFFHRPTKPASFWEDDPHIVGGRDQEKGREGGTWMAVSKDGRIGALLNILQPAHRVDPTKRGRGFLVVDFIKSTMDGNAYLTKLMKEKDEFNGFLFVAIEAKPLKKKISMSYYSNLQEGGPVQTEPGFHAFGNSVPPQFWAKVKYGKQKFEELIRQNNRFSQKDQLLEKIYDFLDESTSYPVDDAMRKQSQEPESTLRLMNQMKYILPNYNYGTRTHSILFVNGAGKAEFIEKTMKEPIDITSKIVWETKSFTFDIA